MAIDPRDTRYSRLFPHLECGSNHRLPASSALVAAVSPNVYAPPPPPPEVFSVDPLLDTCCRRVLALRHRGHPVGVPACFVKTAIAAGAPVSRLAPGYTRGLVSPPTGVGLLGIHVTFQHKTCNNDHSGSERASQPTPR